MGPDDTTEVTETSDSDEATSSDSTDETSAPQVRAASRRRASRAAGPATDGDVGPAAASVAVAQPAAPRVRVATPVGPPPRRRPKLRPVVVVGFAVLAVLALVLGVVVAELFGSRAGLGQLIPVHRHLADALP